MFMSSDNIWELWPFKSEFWQIIKNITEQFFRLSQQTFNPEISIVRLIDRKDHLRNAP